MPQGPVVLCILDGWGYRPEKADNAIALASTPNWDRLIQDHPHTFLDASGLDVGLPIGQMGNSEVGHMSIGSGRIILQDLPRIDQAIRDNSLPNLPACQEFIQTLKQKGKACHLMGLLSPGGVHAHQDHIVALAQLLNQHAIPTFIHAFFDGRDTPPCSAHQFLTDFLERIQNLSHVKLASGCGRYFAMDRDNRWERVEKAYRMLVSAEAPKIDDPLQHLKSCYTNDITDEFILPFVTGEFLGMQDGDAILMANFRADRVREMLRALLLPDFRDFDRHKVIHFSAALGMSEYADDLMPVIPALFGSQEIRNGLGEIVSNNGLKQLRIAETEKYAHVTFFFNGGREEPFKNEDRCLLPSPKVATYDLQPEMAAPEITAKVIEAINTDKYDLIVINYANPDMVGHTGNLKASIQAVECIDHCLGQIMQAIDFKKGTLAITADHGNVEMMVEPETQERHTAHTLNVVPLVLYSSHSSNLKLNMGGTLADIAPTILSLMNLACPKEMTGKSLIINSEHVQAKTSSTIMQ